MTAIKVVKKSWISIAGFGIIAGVFAPLSGIIFPSYWTVAKFACLDSLGLGILMMMVVSMEINFSEKKYWCLLTKSVGLSILGIMLVAIPVAMVELWWMCR